MSSNAFLNHSWKHPSFVPLQLLAVALVASICQPAFASSNCVNPGGKVGCHSTIAAAVAAASPGSTIKVAPGTYKEDVVIGKSLSLIGAGFSDTIIDATGLNNAIYVDGLDNPGLRNVSISGFTVENAKFEGLLVTNATNVTILSNYAHDNNTNLALTTDTCIDPPPYLTGESFDCGEGLHIMGVSWSTFANNVSQNNSAVSSLVTTPARPTTISSPETSSRAIPTPAESCSHRTLPTSARRVQQARTTALFTTPLPTTPPRGTATKPRARALALASFPTAAESEPSLETSSSTTYSPTMACLELPFTATSVLTSACPLTTSTTTSSSATTSPATDPMSATPPTPGPAGINLAAAEEHLSPAPSFGATSSKTKTLMSSSIPRQRLIYTSTTSSAEGPVLIT